MNIERKVLLSRIKYDWSDAAPSLKRALLAAVMAWIPIVFVAHGYSERIELRLADWWFAVRGAREAPSTVSIVRLDKPAYDLVNLSTGEMFPRRRLAEIVETVAASGAKAVVLDFIFQRELDDSEGDIVLAQTLKHTPSVIGRYTEVLTDVDETGRSRQRRISVRPLPMFAQAASHVVSLEIPVSRGVSRHISLGAARHPAAQPVPLLLPLQRFVSPDLIQPGDFDFINFYGGPSTLTSRSAAEVLTAGDTINPAYFRDRVVFIGFIGEAGVGMAAAKDTFLTPTSSSPMYGVEIHATVAANLIDGTWIRRLPLQAEAVAMAVAAFLASFVLMGATTTAAPALAILFMGAWLGASYAAFSTLYWFLPGLTLCMVLTLAVIIRWGTLALSRQTRR